MTHIILDSSLSSQLHALSHPVELCDPSGRVLGRFVPQVDMSQWEPATPDLSDEEMEQRARSQEKRYTTAEVIAHLKGL